MLFLNPGLLLLLHKNTRRQVWLYVQIADSLQMMYWGSLGFYLSPANMHKSQHVYETNRKQELVSFFFSTNSFSQEHTT